MSADSPTALLADDEPLLRQSLARMLREAWPELTLVAQARNGREAVAMFERHAPDICFLDVRMPGLSGIDAARVIGRRAHIVFVTAYTDYAVQAFDTGALDYLVKPVESARLEATLARLRERLGTGAPQDMLGRLEELAARLENRPANQPLRWLKASVGSSVQLIDAGHIVFLRSDEKYTVVVWRDVDGTERESLVRIPLKELVSLLDPSSFVQVHRSYAVNLAAVSHVVKHENENGTIHLRDNAGTIPVSRSSLHLFRQM